MTTVDVIVTPTTPDPAPLLGEVAAFMSKRKSLFSRAFNVTGSPALSTPSGFSSDGLPLSMQIVGRPFQDDLVLKVGHAYEKATAWRDRRPVIAEPFAAAAQ